MCDKYMYINVLTVFIKDEFMAIKNLIILLFAGALVAACNSGGGSSGGSTPAPSNNLPLGMCNITQMQSAANIPLNPTIYSNPTGFLVTYNNFAGSYIQFIYSENQGLSDSFFADGIGTKPSTSSACAQSPIKQLGSITTYNNNVMYLTQCSATLQGSQMSFSANYGIYLPAQFPGNGTPLRAGTVNFTCTLQ